MSAAHGQRYRDSVLALCVFSYFATMAARTVVSPVLPSIRDAFLVSNAAMGLVLTGMWGADALSSYPSGVLGDRYGERRVVLAAIGLSAVGSAFLTLSPTYPVFLLSTLFLGAGAGFGLARELYLLIGAGGSAGVGALADVAGWTTAFGALAGLLALCTAAVTANRLLDLGL